MIVIKKRNTYKKIELLLYKYKDFKKAIKDRQEEIKEIKKIGVKENSKSIVILNKEKSYKMKTNKEVEEEKIKEIEKNMILTKILVDRIDTALEDIKNDIYYKIIELKYFENKTIEEIAEYISCDYSTVYRNKNRIIKELQGKILTEEFIKEVVLF